MRGSKRLQAPHRFRELSLGADAPAAPGLVPGDRDVHEPLEEVTFLCWRGAPRELELLVRGEVLAATDELDAVPKASTRRRRREAVRALPARPSQPGSRFGHVLGVRTAGFDADSNFSVVDLDVVGAQLDREDELVLPGAHVVLPAVPGAGQEAVLQSALPQRPGEGEGGRLHRLAPA